MERKVHPRKWTYENIAAMKAQLKSMGLSLDWSREIATCDPAYYKHQQKMFLDFLGAGLVERRKSKVNWDPVDQTVLANEQVIDGLGWRSGAIVEQRELTQWFFKITEYAQELARRARYARSLAGKSAADAEELDRPLGRLAGALRARSENRAERRNRIGSVHHAAGHAVWCQVHGRRARSSAGRGGGEEKSEARRVHRGMPASRHRASRHRHRREARLRHRHPRAPSVRQNLDAAGLCGELYFDGIRHRRHFRLPGARSARPRICQQIRARQHAGRLPAGRRSEDIRHHRHPL